LTDRNWLVNRIVRRELSVALASSARNEPRWDFYRFTEYGLRHPFDKAGFETVEIKPLSGFWVTFGQHSVCYLWKFRRGGKANPLWWLVPPFCFALQRLCFVLDRIDSSAEFTWMYMVTAQRPAEGAD